MGMPSIGGNSPSQRTLPMYWTFFLLFFRIPSAEYMLDKRLRTNKFQVHLQRRQWDTDLSSMFRPGIEAKLDAVVDERD
jgi:hypothetical protein